MNGNPKLNLAFVANLFNNYPALDLEDIEQEIEPYEENREEKSMMFSVLFGKTFLHTTIRAIDRLNL